MLYMALYEISMKTEKETLIAEELVTASSPEVAIEVFLTEYAEYQSQGSSIQSNSSKIINVYAVTKEKFGCNYDTYERYPIVDPSGEGKVYYDESCGKYITAATATQAVSKLKLVLSTAKSENVDFYEFSAKKIGFIWHGKLYHFKDLEVARDAIITTRGEYIPEWSYEQPAEKDITTNNFETKSKIVSEGKSTIFSSWCELVPTLTAEDFISNLKWVCEDPCEKGDGTGRLTREIGLTNSGIIHINRIFDGLASMYRADTGELWEGDSFKVSCIEKFVKNADIVKRNGYADSDGMVTLSCKLSLSARDRV